MSSFIFFVPIGKNFKFEVNRGAYFLRYGVKYGYGTGGVAKPTLPYFLGRTPPPFRGGTSKGTVRGARFRFAEKMPFFLKRKKYGVRGRWREIFFFKMMFER